MAKVALIFEDGKEDQIISYYSDRNISLDDDLNKLTKAEALAAIAMQLLGDYIEKAGADVEYERPLDNRLN
jgi:hypothetical protein